MTTMAWVLTTFLDGIPPKPEPSVVTWAEKHVRLPGSARGDRFSIEKTPWLRGPMESIGDGVTRRLTLVKPVQTGGSVLGEVALCWTIANSSGGDIQYNWENDVKAKERWKKRIEKILKACPPVMSWWPMDREKATNCMVIFPHLNLTVQGTQGGGNLDSDSIRVQINEELHNWEPGLMGKAYKRTTAFWDSLILNISNASKIGDQLHQALENGTNQEMEVPCPACGAWHAMRIRTEEGQLGGLRYDAEGCRLENGRYNYHKLAPTVFYEFPCCGHRMENDLHKRRDLASKARAGAPRNPGAPLSDRSFTYEAVLCHDIDWLDLIREKHEAIRAMKLGDPEPFRRYVTERENRFWDPDDRPIVEKITLTDSIQPGVGMPDPYMRGMTVDKQGGSAARGEAPHFWVVIRDFDQIGNSQLVWEGKVQTKEDVEALRVKFEVPRNLVLVDSGFDATGVYEMCARYGYCAIKGEDRYYWTHEITEGNGNKLKVRRVYAPIQRVDPFAGKSRAGQTTVPLVLYSKQGIRDHLAYVRAAEDIQWLVPEGVSRDYKKHMVAEEQRERLHPRTGETVLYWHQVARRNDLFVCECYQILLAELAGVIGSQEEEGNNDEG